MPPAAAVFPCGPTLTVQKAEDARNSRDPERVAPAYSIDSEWRNRSEFLHNRRQIIEFLQRIWAAELDYRLIKEIWAHGADRKESFTSHWARGRPITPACLI